MVVRFSYGCAVLLLPIVAACARAENGPDATRANELFERAASSTGMEYAAAREQLLQTPGAEAALTAAKNDADLPDETRWLAEMLLLRLRHPATVKELEDAFHAKCAGYYASADIRGDLYFPPALLRKENMDIPTVLLGYYRMGMRPAPRPPLPDVDAVLSGEVSDEIATMLADYYEKKLLPPSPHWPLIAGEILLKGWTRTAELPDDYTEEFGRGGGPGDGFQRERKITALAHKFYTTSAITILAELKEERARSAVERLLRDKNMPTLKFLWPPRHRAVMFLGALGNVDSVDCLKAAALDGENDYSLRIEAVRSLAAIGGEQAVAALREITAKDDPRGYARESLRELEREREARTEK